MVTNTSCKCPRYTYKKGQVYYYSRAVPIDLIEHYSCKRIVLSLRTKSFHQANLIANNYNSSLEQYWLSIRLQQCKTSMLKFTKDNNDKKISDLPTILDAKNLYFDVKGKGKPKLFFDTANRNIRYLVDCLDNRPLDCYTTKDASQFREWLLKKGLSNSSLHRIFSGIKAIVNLCIKEQGLECQNSFSRVYLPAESKATKRQPISQNDLLALSHKCYEINDDIRWLVALIINTGMRLSEVIGLLVSDLNLESDIPHLIIQPHKHRRLKTEASERIIPLAGVSLWAAEQIKSTILEGFCFPRYVVDGICKSNSASASINKWIKSVGSKNNVVHGLRHSFRDRLRNAEAPTDMIDQLGGWSLKSIGQTYGNGYNLELMYKYILKISSNDKPDG
jgi:integrase